MPFRKFVNVLPRRHITKTALLAVIGLLKENDILDTKKELKAYLTVNGYKNIGELVGEAHRR